ncbi:hypothetical protein llap_5680 [Limosa lapponica baueri]|uniref:Rna-directed dna polymerase from mobile element jockey-like n=1 Tax=Limosa lapponica baueri TaxID=1758121 RepID=A0A2I0UDA7_LIMLA|nr:hypothetical protein llap_5680 [Limosa lapponica baueri]
MRFNKAKCKVLHMDWGNPKDKYRLDGEWIGSSPAEKDLGIMVDEKLDQEINISIAIEKLDKIYKGNIGPKHILIA